MFWKVPEPTDAQRESIEIIKNEHALTTTNTFDEIVIDHDMKCKRTDDNNLEAVPIDHGFIFEFQEDMSIVVIVEEIFDKGYNLFTETHRIEIDGTIHDL